MAPPQVSRRGVVAGVVAALGGCVGGSNESDDPTGDGTVRDVTRTPGNATSERSSTTRPVDEESTETTATDDTTDEPDATDDAATAVEWEEVAAFRRWLTDYSTIPNGNSRFDYQRGYAEAFVEGGRVAFLDLPRDGVDGHLTQSGTVVHLGAFDRESLVERVEASDDHELTGEHEGYALGRSEATGSEVAVGDDAVLAGSEVTPWIDARVGTRDRLETVDPDFTRLFRRLPDRGVVAGQYGPPTGGRIDLEAISLWGHSMPSLDADTATWVYLFDEESALTDDALATIERGLEPLTEEITAASADGRFATITATPVRLD